MTFVVDETKLKHMASQAFFGSVKGRAGIVVAVLCVVGGMLLNAFLHSAGSGGLADRMHARDTASMGVLGIVALCVSCTVAFGVLYGTWRSCNEFLGRRCDSAAQLDGEWLQYTYRPFEFNSSHTRFVVFVRTANMGLERDERTDLLTVRGEIYTMLCRNVATDWPQSLQEMDRVDSFCIPNCFAPDLYNALCAYAR